MKKIAIVLGSKNDSTILKEALELLDKLAVGYKLEVLSAHRNPEELRKFCKSIEKEGIEVAIAVAGKAAALPGFMAAYLNIPVIGVALKGGLMDGLDALFSIVSTPKGLGLVCSGVGESAFINALIFALEIISLKDKSYIVKLKDLKSRFK